MTDEGRPVLAEEVRSVLNRHSAENASSTPDFILATYLLACLAAFDDAVSEREAWYGRTARMRGPDPTSKET